jgi:hypothetical protein
MLAKAVGVIFLATVVPSVGIFFLTVSEGAGSAGGVNVVPEIDASAGVAALASVFCIGLFLYNRTIRR